MSSFSGRSDFRQRQDRDAAYRTGNPILSERRFATSAASSTSRSIATTGERMTIEGTANKTGVLLLCALVPAMFVWSRFFTDQSVGGFIALGAIGGLIVALVTTFKAEWSPVTAPIYAALEGLFIGGLSAVMEARLPGIALQAGGLTFGVLFTMLALYKACIIRVTDTFRTVILAATGGIALVYLVSGLMRLFTGYPIPLIHEGGVFGIIFSLVVVGVAAFNLAMDFDFIETAADEGAPKFMEWYGAFGLMVTLVWLYIEILRLLAKLRSDD
jgi:uncharacterized YccA/Bax inhibitor family protein